MTLREKIKSFLDNRNLVIEVILVLICIAFLIRLVDLQIINGESYRKLSQNKMVRTTANVAARGTIYDRNGVVLASSKIGYDVVLYNTSISNEKLNDVLLKVTNIVEKNKDKVVSNLPMNIDGFNFISDSSKNTFLEMYGFSDNISFEEAFNKLCKRYEIKDDLSVAEKLKILNLRYEITKNGYSLFTYVTIANNVSYETMAYIEEIKNELGGIVVLSSPKRYYNYGSSLAHVLGYVSSINAEEYSTLKDQGYSQNSIIGKTGIEYFLESYLKGENGKIRTEINSSGTATYEYVYKESVSGKDVTLTIDYRLQKIAENALENMIKSLQSEKNGKYTDASSGAVVITSVKTGEVLALVSYPSYDPNLFISGISYSDWEKINNDANIPMFNRATQGTYPPGSTFKMLSAIAGLETGKITSDELIQDTGVYPYSYNPVCWIYTDYRRTHGYINVSDAIKVSCNCYFYEVGRRVGIKTLVEYALKFGLNSKTGIELTEATGTIAGTQNIDWYLGDTLSAAIGQSYNSFTPVELANYIATLANGGTLNRLTLIKKIGENNEVSDSELNQYIEEKTDVKINPTKIKLKENTLNTVLSGMERSSMETGGGTYYVFGRNNVEVAGKTGTAEVATGSANALFGGYAPIKNPDIAIVVVIEHGGSGLNAAVVARDIVNEYYNIRKQESSVKSNQNISDQEINF